MIDVSAANGAVGPQYPGARRTFSNKIDHCCHVWSSSLARVSASLSIPVIHHDGNALTNTATSELIHNGAGNFDERLLHKMLADGEFRGATTGGAVSLSGPRELRWRRPVDRHQHAAV